MTVENINPEKEPIPAGWVPRVIQGGKGPPEPPGNNKDWLAELTPGTTFVCRANEHYIDYELYHVVFKTLECVLLKWELPDGKFWDRFVNTKEFSKRYQDYVILGVGKEEENDGNGQCHQVRSGDMVLHETVQGIDQVVPEAERSDLQD